MSFGITVLATFAWGTYCGLLTRLLRQSRWADLIATWAGCFIIILGNRPK